MGACTLQQKQRGRSPTMLDDGRGPRCEVALHLQAVHAQRIPLRGTRCALPPAALEAPRVWEGTHSAAMLPLRSQAKPALRRHHAGHHDAAA
eukprot:968517-Prymnesium_polylepis.2